jgi:hypothetical protein
MAPALAPCVHSERISETSCEKANGSPYVGDPGSSRGFEEAWALGKKESHATMKIQTHKLVKPGLRDSVVFRFVAVTKKLPFACQLPGQHQPRLYEGVSSQMGKSLAVTQLGEKILRVKHVGA